MKLGVFYDESMPYVGLRPDKKVLSEISGFAELIDCVNYKQAVQYDCLINLHGPYFIKEVWSYIRNHLGKGRGFVNIGCGNPFSRPVSHRDNGWYIEREQTGYHEKLNIYDGLAVKKDRMDCLCVNNDIPVLKGFEDCFEIQDTVGFIVQFTQ